MITTEEEKEATKKLTKQFLVRKYIFLGIIAKGKGIIPYKKIVSQDSLDLTPENGIFFEKSEFYIEFKQKFVSD